MSAWYVYLIECVDGSVYTGIAVDVERRYAQHAAGKGARYTRSHPPWRLLARFEYPDRGAASRAEYAIKQLTPARKRMLCEAGVAPAAPFACPEKIPGRLPADQARNSAKSNAGAAPPSVKAQTTPASNASASMPLTRRS